MPRHLLSSEEVVIQDEGSPLPVRSKIKFQGEGVASVTDDSGNSRTVVSVAGGSGGYIGYRRYLAGPDTVGTATQIGVDAGLLDSSGGDVSWFDEAGSSPSTGQFYFSAVGLYRFTIFSSFTASATRLPADRFGLEVGVYPGTQVEGRSYFIPKGFVIHRGHPTDASTRWSAVVSVTDYFGQDGPDQGLIECLWLKGNAMADVTNLYTEINVSRIL